MNLFLNMKVQLGEAGPVGRIDSTFGKTKFKPNPTPTPTPTPNPKALPLPPSPTPTPTTTPTPTLTLTLTGKTKFKCVFTDHGLGLAGLQEACKGAKLYLRYTRRVNPSPDPSPDPNPSPSPNPNPNSTSGTSGLFSTRRRRWCRTDTRH